MLRLSTRPQMPAMTDSPWLRRLRIAFARNQGAFGPTAARRRLVSKPIPGCGRGTVQRSSFTAPARLVRSTTGFSAGSQRVRSAGISRCNAGVRHSGWRLRCNVDPPHPCIKGPKRPGWVPPRVPPAPRSGAGAGRSKPGPRPIDGLRGIGSRLASVGVNRRRQSFGLRPERSR
jgi:hypothetical protein